MFNNGLKLCLITLLTFGLAFSTACGDDEPADNNKNNVNNTNNGDKDTGGGDKDTDNTDNDTDNTDKDTGGETPEVETLCDGDDAPARCTADPETFEFGIASVISKLAIASSSGECCFDFDGDGEADNALGTALGLSPGMLDTVNTSLADNIADNTLTVVLEHQGLEALTGGDFTINFFLGLYDGADLLINPASFDAGTQPLAFLPGAKLTEAGAVTAGPGNVILNLELFGTALELSIREAKVSAAADATNSSLTEGVSLINGKLGGLIIVNEVFDAVNKVAATCDCLGLAAGTDLIDYSSGAGKCATVTGHTCEAESTCDTVATNCGIIAGAALLADQDYAGGTENALSIGATFEAQAAVISGVAAE